MRLNTHQLLDELLKSSGGIETDCEAGRGINLRMKHNYCLIN